MSKRRPRRDHSRLEASEFEPRRSVVQHPATLLVLIAAIGGLMYLAYQASIDQQETTTQGTIQSDTGTSESTEVDESETAVDETVANESAADDDSTEASSDDQAGSTTTETSEPPASSTPAAIPDPDGTFVAARLDLDSTPGNGLFRLSGRVPDQELADQVRLAAELSYGPFVESDLQVDESLPPAEWMAVAPRVIGLLPSVTDGTLMVADGKILLSARSPNTRYLQQLQGGLGFLAPGMPVEVVDAVITDLEPPLLKVEAADGSIKLGGHVPSEEVELKLVGAAVAAYGASNVVNELEIRAGTYQSFWMEIMPGALQLLRVYPTYNFAVEDGQFAGVIQGGIQFEADSTEITEATAQALDVGISILARDISIGMTVTGHTDAQGPDEYNLALSQARADSVIEYFAAGGIDRARLVAKGAGETQPITDNDTEEGRSINRRVEFHFGPVLELQR